VPNRAPNLAQPNTDHAAGGAPAAPSPQVAAPIEPSPNVLLRQRAFVPVPLSQLRPGERARVHAEGLKCESCDLLTAMGLADRCELRVCKVGEPCIVQVNETRLGISRRLAQEILVTRLDDAGARRDG
jgi:Fe2+ transport system protein FeoA